MKILSRIFGGLVFLSVTLVIGGYFYLKGSLPKLEGETQVEGLQNQVEITRDQNGVPHILAQSDHDAFFTMGYLHAQDRMWQLETQRRAGAGRLSEIFGGALLKTDKYMRTLGLYRLAKESFTLFDPKVQEAIQTYANGVNAWLNEGNTLPSEYILLNFEPEPWSVFDSVVWVKLMSLSLSENSRVELLQADLERVLGSSKTEELFPGYPANGPTTLRNEDLQANRFPLKNQKMKVAHLQETERQKAIQQIQGKTLYDLNALLQQLELGLNLGGKNVGSNAWVVSGKFTQSGKPIVANDPHLGTQIPSLWYLAELKGDQLHAAGATFPGLPFIIFGNNQQIAWGGTNLGADVQDIYLERINPENPNQYEVDGKMEDMLVVEETILVKQGFLSSDFKSESWMVRNTRHGPLLSDVSKSDVGSPFSMRWVSLEKEDKTIESFYRIGYAKNWKDFKEAIRPYLAPGLNFVYGDVEGNIGYFASGKVPVRNRGKGKFPLEGWDRQNDWKGWIPFEEMPQGFNPKVGYFVTSNNKSVPDQYPHFLTDHWAPAYRAARITELLEQKIQGDQKISVQDMMEIQGDQTSLQPQNLLSLMLKEIVPQTAKHGQALRYLREWDGKSRVDGIASTIYHAWVFELGELMLADELPDEKARNRFKRLIYSLKPIFYARVLSGESTEPWCDNKQTPEHKENCQEILIEALNGALADLEIRLGDNMEEWEWGKLHQLVFPHTPFSQIPGIKGLYERKIANGGMSNSVNTAPASSSPSPFRYQQNWHASFREVIDLGDLKRGKFIVTPGQSGNVMSPYYDNLMERHRDIKFLDMDFGNQNLSGLKLILIPTKI